MNPRKRWFDSESRSLSNPFAGKQMHKSIALLVYFFVAGLAQTHAVAAECDAGAVASADCIADKTEQTVRVGPVPAIDVGGSSNILATATSGLAVSLRSITPEVCSVSGNTLLGILAGTCAIEATQDGNSTFNVALPVQRSITIHGTLPLSSAWNLLGNHANTSIDVASTFGDVSKVSSVWKWQASYGRWAFYSPTLSDGGAAHAAGEGFDFLTSIKGGEGFWVNAKTPGAVSMPPRAPTCGGTGTALELVPSWNLLSNNINTPMSVEKTFGDPLKVTSVWKWLPRAANWAFYSPTLDGGAAYAVSHGLELLTSIESGEGFWVNAATAFTVPLPTVPSVCQCDRAAQLDKVGNVIFPAEAGEIELPVDVDDDAGSIATLYPGLDTTTDAFYPNLPCGDQMSIGGTLPVEVPPAPIDAEAEEFLHQFESSKGAEILEQLRANPLPAISLLGGFTMGGCSLKTEATAASPGSSKPVPCDNPVFLNSSMPFEGRDIIYVHGLDIRPIKARIADPLSTESLRASKIWPLDSSEFLNAGGYFRTNAENYWRPHITEHLSSQNPVHLTAGWQWTATDAAPVYVPKPNRYLIAAWSANQTIEYAQHALLTQIHIAMTSGTNVVTPASYPANQVRPFCSNGCIVIGHSTGPLITSSAMGLARTGFFGPGGKEVAKHVVAHVSFAGAISGSRISSMTLAATALISPGPVPSGVCDILTRVFDQNFCAGNTSFVANSILRDLVPAVSQSVWGVAVGLSNVPTVTFAGGHPSGNQGITGLFLSGTDDGVVTMNSACGNPNPIFPGISPPSGLTVSNPLKAFEYSDLNARLTRGASIFLAQKNLKAIAPGPLYRAGGCTPNLSASGMVMPVLFDWSGYLPFDSRTRYPNHYSFMQSLAEHSHDGGNSIPNEWPSQFGFAASAALNAPTNPPSPYREYTPFMEPGSNHPSSSPQHWHVNVEESRAVTDASIYTRLIDTNGTHLVKPLDMHEIRRGRKVSFSMPWNIGNCEVRSGFHPILPYRCTTWIWKRTYHLADKWEKKQSSHYAYEYVGRR